MISYITRKPFVTTGVLSDKGTLTWEEPESRLPAIVVISSYPPRQCGIATYSQDLVLALRKKFGHSFSLRICALETATEQHAYSGEVQYVINTDEPTSFRHMQQVINDTPAIQLVLLQHEFGLFAENDERLISFMYGLAKPVLIVFHTVLPEPGSILQQKVKGLTNLAAAVIVMTLNSQQILINEYGVAPEKISVIPHGTHLVTHADKMLLKDHYNLTGRKVLSTFGLLSSGKSLETTVEALPAIVAKYPDVLFLIIGKTHPSVVKQEGEQYRQMLENRIDELQLNAHVLFINKFLPLSELLDYLQLTDIYLFTSKDPNQAVSGTFSYAISCGCAVISTPIPHAKEVLKDDGGIIIDFRDSLQLTTAVHALLGDDKRRQQISSNGLHLMASTAWENAAIAHAMLFEQLAEGKIELHYEIPAINLDHIKKLTTSFGMIQFSVINQPDISSGYTLDDNARALIAMCRHFELTGDREDLRYIKIYFHFIKHCLQQEGHFLNYVKEERQFTAQNQEVNLADANGRAVWALGYLLSLQDKLPLQLIAEAAAVMTIATLNVSSMHSTRAMAFVIKGLYYRNKYQKEPGEMFLVKELADRLLQMYRHEADDKWRWFESYLTYANSILPEAMLCAWLTTGDAVYKETAKASFDFLLSKTFDARGIKVISNRSWLHHGDETARIKKGGEQPIDVAYTILALSKFYDVFREEEYKTKMELAFNWFLGSNHLHQIMYNPCTGGCYDGLEESNVNLNQGAESTVSYLLARLTMEEHFLSTATRRPSRLKQYV